MVYEVLREIHIGDVQVLAINEFFKMVANENLHFFQGHPGRGLFGNCGSQGESSS